jgi:hypothetical protein
VLDLNNDKYSGEIKRAISDYAYRRLDDLRQQRHVNAALFRWAWSTISAAAPDNHWVDLTCLQLRALPHDASDIHIRRILECSDCSSDNLMHSLWTKLLASASDIEETKELLRALVCAFRDPTIEELALLCGYEKNLDRLHGALHSCKPLVNLVTATSADHSSITTVEFAMPEIKAHLAANLKLLSLNEEAQKRQHMFLAWKCFDALQDSLVTIYEGAQSPSDDAIHESPEEPSSSPIDDDESSMKRLEPQRNAAIKILSERGLLYAVQHWMHHGAIAGAHFAEPFVKEDSATKVPEKFWQAWLYFYTIEGKEFRNISNDWTDFRTQHQRAEKRRVYEARNARHELEAESEFEDASDADGEENGQDFAAKTDKGAEETFAESSMGEAMDHETGLEAGIEVVEATRSEAVQVTEAPEENGANKAAITEEAHDMTEEAIENMTVPSAGACQAASQDTAGEDKGNSAHPLPEHMEPEMPNSILDRLKLIHIAAAFGFEELVRVILDHSTDDVGWSDAHVFGYTPVSTVSILSETH